MFNRITLIVDVNLFESHFRIYNDSHLRVWSDKLHVIDDPVVVNYNDDSISYKSISVTEYNRNGTEMSIFKDTRTLIALTMEYDCLHKYYSSCYYYANNIEYELTYDYKIAFEVCLHNTLCAIDKWIIYLIYDDFDPNTEIAPLNPSEIIDLMSNSYGISSKSVIASQCPPSCTNTRSE